MVIIRTSDYKERMIDVKVKRENTEK
jgi:hypothetical protein